MAECGGLEGGQLLYRPLTPSVVYVYARATDPSALATPTPHSIIQSIGHCSPMIRRARHPWSEPCRCTKKAGPIIMVRTLLQVSSGVALSICSS